MGRSRRMDCEAVYDAYYREIAYSMIKIAGLKNAMQTARRNGWKHLEDYLLEADLAFQSMETVLFDKGADRVSTSGPSGPRHT